MECESASPQDLSHEMLRRSVDNILLHLPTPKRERALTPPIITEYRNVYKCIKGTIKFTKYEKKNVFLNSENRKMSSPERFSVSPMKVPEEVQENINIKLVKSLWVASTACDPSAYFADRRPANAPRRKRRNSVPSIKRRRTNKSMRMDVSEEKERLEYHAIGNRHSFPDFQSLKLVIKEMDVDFSNLCTNNSSDYEMKISDTLTESVGNTINI